MTSTVPVVDGCRSFDPRYNFWVTFETITDALFAQLSLKHGLAWDAIDAIIDLLQNPLFDLPELNLKNASDIDNRVSKCRLQAVEELLMPSGVVGKSGMPMIVLELVVDYMVNDVVPFIRKMQHLNTNVKSEYLSIQDSLEQMCIVDRPQFCTAYALESRQLLFDCKGVGSDLAALVSLFYPEFDI